MNIVILVGRLVRDPELRKTNSGKSVASFSVAVDKRVGRNAVPGAPTAEFVNIGAWDRQAEVICQYLSKGRQIALRGHLQTRQFQDRNGATQYRTEVVLDEFDFVGDRGGQSQSNSYNQDQPAPAPQQSRELPLEIDDDFSLMADDEDVPF